MFVDWKIKEIEFLHDSRGADWKFLEQHVLCILVGDILDHNCGPSVCFDHVIADRQCSTLFTGHCASVPSSCLIARIIIIIVTIFHLCKLLRALILTGWAKLAIAKLCRMRKSLRGDVSFFGDCPHTRGDKLILLEYFLDTFLTRRWFTPAWAAFFLSRVIDVNINIVIVHKHHFLIEVVLAGTYAGSRLERFCHGIKRLKGAWR